MQQPELGIRLTALRKAKNLTQEALVEKSHVSVRTIQRIETGDVLPRASTVKILLAAMGEDYETFSRTVRAAGGTENTLPIVKKNILLTAALSGVIYVVAQVILGIMDIIWLTKEFDWGLQTKGIYMSLSVIMLISYVLFARGFIALSKLFENGLLKGVTYMLIAATAGMAVLDITTLWVEDPESLWLAYVVFAILFGGLSITMGIALIRLQDSMGELSRIAGMLEIVIGCLLATVVLFFIVYIIMIPAIVLEIIVLYRGYEYLSQSRS